MSTYITHKSQSSPQNLPKKQPQKTKKKVPTANFKKQNPLLPRIGTSFSTSNFTILKPVALLKSVDDPIPPTEMLSWCVFCCQVLFHGKVSMTQWKRWKPLVNSSEKLGWMDEWLKSSMIFLNNDHYRREEYWNVYKSLRSRNTNMSLKKGPFRNESSLPTIIFSENIGRFQLSI